MSDVNRVLLVGRLGRDPELRTTASGADVVHLSVATGERWTDRASSEKRERTEWHRVVAFREGIVRFAREHLRRGDPVFVEGSLRTRRWTDQDGHERFTTEVVARDVRLLTRPGGGNGQGGDTAAECAQPTRAHARRHVHTNVLVLFHSPPSYRRA